MIELTYSQRRTLREMCRVLNRGIHISNLMRPSVDALVERGFVRGVSAERVMPTLDGWSAADVDPAVLMSLAGEFFDDGRHE